MDFLYFNHQRILFLIFIICYVLIGFRIIFLTFDVNLNTASLTLFYFSEIDVNIPSHIFDSDTNSNTRKRKIVEYSSEINKNDQRKWLTSLIIPSPPTHMIPEKSTICTNWLNHKDVEHNQKARTKANKRDAMTWLVKG